MQKIGIFVSIILIVGFAKAQKIEPKLTLHASGGVYDFYVEAKTLYAATDEGCVDIFDLKNHTLINKILLPKITDFSGEKVAPKIYAIDKIDNLILITSEGQGGYRDIFLYRDKRLTKLKSAETDKLMVHRAVFVDKYNILIGLMSNELILYDFNIDKQSYRIQLGTSVFSDFTQGTCRELAVTCDESGKLRQINIRNGKIIRTFEGQNLDKVYKTDYAKHTFLTGGQDRKVGVYRLFSESYNINSDFLVYAVALSSDAALGAYQCNEQNEIRVFDVETRQEIAILSGQKCTLTKIYFIDNQTLVSSSEDNEILFWKIN